MGHYTIVHWVCFLVIGGVIGWLVGIITGGWVAIIRGIVVGVIGAIFGGFMAGVTGLSNARSINAFLLAISGAAVLVGLTYLLERKHQHRRQAVHKKRG